MSDQHIADDATILTTRIPEGRRVEGLEYGDHVSRSSGGWAGCYVRPVGTIRWGIARLTPASDEVYDTDDEIVEAIEAEL